MTHRQKPITTRHARELRKRQTEAESLLWYVLRGRRMGGFKFRRQYPVGPFVVDFACVAKRFVVEIDGGYHDFIYEDDRMRQQQIESADWNVLRFRNEDVLDGIDAVAVAIARHLGVESEFRGENQS